VSKPLDNQNKTAPSNAVAKTEPVKKIQPVVEEDEDDIL
jgi:hypothetical protein